MYTKTGFGLLAAAGVAVGVIGMTMGGASSAPSAMCEPTSGTSADAPSVSGSDLTTARPASADVSGANASSNANGSGANGSGTGPAGPAGPLGPNGPAGTDDDGSNGSDPSGSTGPDGSTGTNGLSGIHINAKGDPKADDDSTGSLSVRDHGSTVPRRVRSGSSILNVRGQSNATNAPATQAPASGTHVNGTSTLLGGLNINGHVNDGH
jgi:hypothetical protein